MIQLASGQTLSAKAGTTNVINVSIFGDLVTTTDDFTPHQVLIPSSVGTLYTSTGGQTNIGSMNMVNTTALDVVNIQFYIIGTNTTTNPITNAFTIPASGWAVYSEGKIVIYNSDGLPLSVVSLSTATPQPLGVAAAGTASLASRSDHVHVMPTLNQVTIPTANVSLNSKKITDLADGSSANDAVNFAQLQSAIDGRENKQSCDLTTIAALPTNTYNNGSSGVGATLTGVAFGALVVDGTTVTAGQRILVKNEAATARNGIYVVTTVGAVATLYVLTRATDFDGSGDVIDAGDTTYVTGGATKTGTTWTVNSGTVTTVGTDPITWTQTAGPGALIGGTGIVITGNTIDAQVDGSTIEIVANTIREKDGGTTNAKLANMAQATFKMRAAAAGTGVPIDGTAAQAKTALAIANTDVSGLGTLSTQSGTFSGTSSGTNTGDQTTSNADGTIGVATGTTNPVLTRPAITGPITIASGSNATVIGATAADGNTLEVSGGALREKDGGTTNAKLANMANLTGKGNISGGSAAPSDLTATQWTASLVNDATLTTAAGGTNLPGRMTTSEKTKLKQHIYDVVNDYGADPTGSTNSATNIQNAINAAQAAGYIGGSGAIVWFPPGRYLINTALSVTGHNITLWGAGGGQSLDFGPYYVGMASTLVPAAGIKAVVVSPVLTNGLSGVTNVGFKWKGLCVDGFANFPTIALQLISCSNFDIDDYYSLNVTDCHIDFNTLPAAALTIAAAFPLAAATLTVNSTAASGSGPAFASSGNVVLRDGTGTPRLLSYTGTTPTTFTGVSSAGLGSGSAPIGGFVQILPGAQDTTRGRVGQINVRALDSSGAPGIGIRLNGDGAGAANTNLINFVGPLKIAHNTGIGIKDINSDTNFFDTFIINRVAGGTGIGVEIGAGPTNALASRNNVFNHGSFGAGGLTARGTPTNTFPSGPTRVMNYQIANGEAIATVEAGAILEVNYNGAFKIGNLTAPSTAAQALTAATVNQLNNTKVAVPPQGFQLGAHLMWSIPLNKTGAVGTSWLYNLRYGTGAVSTGAILQTITYTATGVADGGVLEIHMFVTALGTSTSATATGYALLSHNLAATGLGTGVTAPASDAAAASGKIYTRPTFAGFDSTLPATGVPQFLSVEINPVTAATVMNTQPGVQAFCLAQANV